MCGDACFVGILLGSILGVFVIWYTVGLCCLLHTQNPATEVSVSAPAEAPAERRPVPAVVTVEPAVGEECTICLDAYTADCDAVCVTICEHRFHRGCLNEWRERARVKPTCPLCRAPLSRRKRKRIRKRDAAAADAAVMT